MSSYGLASGVYLVTVRRLINWLRSNFRFYRMYGRGLMGDLKSDKKTLARFVATNGKRERGHLEDGCWMGHFDRDHRRCFRKTPQYGGIIIR